MRITRLNVHDVRSIREAGLAPGAGLNLIVGNNGAGKSSILEAVHVLGYGRSFRGRVRDGLIRTGAEAMQVFAEWRDGMDRPRRIGLRHAGADWVGKLDGERVDQLGDLCAALAVITFEPNSHALVSGGGDPRRRYLDWGLFHVEPDYLGVWRRYARALKQRNALLKHRNGGGQLDAWDQELAGASDPLRLHREAYVAALLPHLRAVTNDLSPGFGEVVLELQPGWKQGEMPLADALLLHRERDLALGYTSVGPHRADWRLRFSGRPEAEPYSRGQAKLVALACILAQASHLHEVQRQWPIVLLDDLASELDAKHRVRVLDRLSTAGAQVFLTGVEAPPELTDRDVRMFHVEHGVVTGDQC